MSKLEQLQKKVHNQPFGLPWYVENDVKIEINRNKNIQIDYFYFIRQDNEWIRVSKKDIIEHLIQYQTSLIKPPQIQDYGYTEDNN